MPRLLFILLISISIVGDISAKCKKIGLLVAVEQQSIFEKYGKAAKVESAGGFDVYSYKNRDYQLFVINSGVGEIAAAAATQVLIDVYNVDLVVNFGVVGALTDEMTVAENCVVEKILHTQFGADICEMECAAIFLTCHRNHVPCIFIKAVSDSLTGDGKEYYQEYLRAAALCLDITDKIIHQL